MGHSHHDDTGRHGSALEHPKASEPEATLQDRISLRTYGLFRAKQGGSDKQDWLQSEREIHCETTSRNETESAPNQGNAKFTSASG